ncbi:MAG: hypothetical protein WC309_01855 [Candidatus Paceibacterota bacterium]|jgi:TolA-binding protein|nr:hypothetical protein [Candidatus Moranbacteria bacterium]
MELSNHEKNNKIKEQEEELEANRIQMEIDKEKISNLKSDINNLNGGFQIAQRSIINIMQNFNDIFPDYEVEI